MSSFLSRDLEDDDLWDGELYRNTCSFVPEFGEILIDWLEPESGERILDVGCGTGELTTKLIDDNRQVIGLDASGNMISEARESHPQPTYIEDDIKEFEREKNFDAAISNAALHWITEPDQALEAIHTNLKTNGRFVAEMGVEGNVRKVRNALYEEVSTMGYDPRALDPWYFPDPAQYIDKLEDAGFIVTRNSSFKRPTELFGEEGLELWLIMFAEEFFLPLNQSERETVIRSLVERLRDELYYEGKWILNYSRLRFKAQKSK